MTTELSQLLEEEENRWMESLQVEEYQISLAKTVIQVGGRLPSWFLRAQRRCR